MEDKKEVMAQESPAAMIKAAVQGGADLEKLEKLLDIQLKYEANEAKKAYHVAMTAFKANPPMILKDKTVSYNETSYKHASLYAVAKSINDGLSKHGLSASWKTAQSGAVSVTCKITHIMGHSEETTLSAAADSSGSKNSIQAIGSTITYLERYSLLALTGLAAFDDDDGVASEVECIDEKQLNTIRDFVDNKEGFEARLLTYLGIESIEKMPKKDYNKAIKAMEAAK